jgi:copper chaperone
MYQLRVEKMTCGGCASRIKRVVQSVDSEAKIEINLRNKSVHVETSVELGILVNAVADAGYPVTRSEALR